MAGWSIVRQMELNSPLVRDLHSLFPSNSGEDPRLLCTIHAASDKCVDMIGVIQGALTRAHWRASLFGKGCTEIIRMEGERDVT